MQSCILACAFLAIALLPTLSGLRHTLTRRSARGWSAAAINRKDALVERRPHLVRRDGFACSMAKPLEALNEFNKSAELAWVTDEIAQVRMEISSSNIPKLLVGVKKKN